MTIHSQVLKQLLLDVGALLQLNTSLVSAKYTINADGVKYLTILEHDVQHELSLAEKRFYAALKEATPGLSHADLTILYDTMTT